MPENRPHGPSPATHGDILSRAQLIHLEVRRLATEAEGCEDPERMTAIRQEIEVLHGSMVEIRREQLRGEVERSRPKARTRWWRRARMGTTNASPSDRRSP